MGRRKQGSDKDKGEVKNGVLEEAWPSSPVRNPRYVLYCYNHENERRWIVNSYGLYAIRKIFDALVGDNEVAPSPLDPDRTVTFGDIDVRSEQLDAILNHQYSKAEEAWELPVPYPNDIEQFLRGRRMGTGVKETDKGDDEYKKARRGGKVPKPVKERIDRTGLITVQKICDDIKMEPRDARAALRKAKIEKPSGGWLGDAAWAKEITEILKKAQAADKKGKK